MPNNQSVQRKKGMQPGPVEAVTSFGSGTRVGACVLWEAGLRRSGRQRPSTLNTVALYPKLIAWLVLILVSQTPSAFARELPLWELAVGVLPSTFPAYRGSEDQNYYLFPFPYIIYRGEILRSDSNGIRALMFHTDRVELNVSTNASVRTRSDNNKARRDMPNLDPTLEVGPSLNIRIADPLPRTTLSLELPVRSVIATDFGSVDQIGWVFHPHLNLDTQNNWGGWNFGLDAGPLFATRKYHDYYYRVKSKFALPDRPEYRPSSGYSGAVGLASFSRRFNSYWLGGFVRYDYLGGTKFDDSPLVETNHSVMAGVAVAWFFAKSSRQVER